MSYGMRGGTGTPNSRNKAPEGYSTGKMENFSPEMMQLFTHLMSQLGPNSFLSKLAGGDQSMFEQMEAPAMRQFSQMQGENASRFSGMGMGARRGSGFQNFQNQATSNFAQDLQAKRLELQRQAISDLMGAGNTLLQQKPYENYMVKNQYEQSPWQDIAGKFVQAIPGAVAGFMTAGPPGAAMSAVNSFASNMNQGSPYQGSQMVRNFQLGR